MMHHVLKAKPEYFQGYASGTKPWSIRNNDRQFQPGDTVRFIEWDCGATGRQTERFTVLAVWRGLDMVPEGHVVLSLAPCTNNGTAFVGGKT